MGTLARNRLIEKRTFLCRLSINHCNILIIYLSIYFTTKKKVYVGYSLCVSFELLKQLLRLHFPCYAHKFQRENISISLGT